MTGQTVTAILGNNQEAIRPKSRLKSQIPPITQTQLDKIIPSFRKEDVKSINFRSANRLFTEPHARAYHDRQTVVLTRIAHIYKDGVPFDKIPNIAELLQNVYLLVMNPSASKLLSPLSKLIDILRYFPFRNGAEDVTLASMGCKQKDILSSNATTLIDVISNFLTINTNNEEFIHSVCQTLYHLCGGIDSSSTTQDTIKIHFKEFSLKQDLLFKPSSESNEIEVSDFLLTAASKSLTLNILLKHISSTDKVASLGTLKCLKKLTQSKELAQLALEANGVQLLLQTMKKCNKDDFIVFLCIQTIWNLLDVTEVGKLTVDYLSTTEPLMLLKTDFVDVTVNGIRQVDKQKRNEILMLIHRITELVPESINILRSIGFFDVAFKLLTETEFGLTENINNQLRMTNKEDDFELKRMLITLMQKFCSDATSRTILVNDGILYFCCIYLCADPENPAYTNWTEIQLTSIQILVLGLLISIIPKTSKDFRSINGPLYLVKFLESSLETQKSLDRKRVDLVRLYVNLIKTTLLCLLTYAETGPTSKKILGELETFPHLLKILDDDSQTPTIWSNTLVLCSSLCHSYKLNRQVFGLAGGVPLAIKYLQFTSADPKEQETVVLAAVECIWGAICGCLQYEDLFLHHDGIFKMLDLLEKESVQIKRHALGCVLDLLENPKAVNHVLQWKMKLDVHKGIENLLIAIWNEEEDRIGVRQGPNGSIPLEIKNPLHGEKVPVVNIIQNGYLLEGSVIPELQENLRVKIYSIFCKLGFEQFSATLSMDEKIKLTLISKYLDFKIGEIWAEITEELKYDRIRPISPDIDCLQSVNAVIQTKVQKVIERQSDIASKNDEVLQKSETTFFNEWKKENIPEPFPPRKPRIHTWRQSLLT